MDKYLSIITNFGCHGRCPYCIVRENGIKVPKSTIGGLDKLEDAIKMTGAKDFEEIEVEELRKVFFTTEEECQAFCNYINGTEVLGYDYNIEGQLIAQGEETE